MTASVSSAADWLSPGLFGAETSMWLIVVNAYEALICSAVMTLWALLPALYFVCPGHMFFISSHNRRVGDTCHKLAPNWQTCITLMPDLLFSKSWALSAQSVPPDRSLCFPSDRWHMTSVCLEKGKKILLYYRLYLELRSSLKLQATSISWL